MLKKLLLGASVFSVLSFQGWSQCPTSISPLTVTSTTPATCPGNGGFAVSVTNATGVQFKLTNGPASGYVTGGQTSGTFTNLVAGTYTVKAFCTADSTVSQQTTVEIADGYQPMIASLASNVTCGGASATKTITATATGGTGTIQYVIWQGAPNVADTFSNYSTANTFTVANYGTYNVRLKDACGVAVTKQITVASPYSSNLQITWMAPWVYGSINCADTTMNASIGIGADGVWLSYQNIDTPGITVEVYEDINNDGIGQPGEHLSAYDAIISKAAPNDNNDIVVPRNKKLLIRVKTPCGDLSNFYVYDGAIAQGQANGSVSVKQSDCIVAPATVANIDLQFDMNDFATMPYTWHVYSNDTALGIDTTNTSSGGTTITGLPNAEYTVVFTDACGKMITAGTGTSYTPLVPPSAALTETISYGCTNTPGKTSARVRIDGYFPSLADPSTTVTIVNGPDAGLVGVRSSARSFWFYNITPGITHNIQVSSTSCGTDTIVPITIPLNNWDTLVQNINTTVNQLCGGKGDITVHTDYNGGGLPTVKLYKVGTTAAIATGSGGIITKTNQDPGKYYAKIDLVMDGGCVPGSLTLTSDTVTILPANSGPVVTRKLSMICEGPTGPGDGKALMEFIGAAPFKVYYKTIAATTWTTYDTANTDGKAVITGLMPYTSYQIQIIDQCGEVHIEPISIGELEIMSVVNTVQPCVNQPYTLEVPDYISATYEWKKAGVVISNARTINFPSFSASNSGEYVCRVVIDSCVVRVDTVTLYSQFNCGTPITNVTVSGNVWNDGNGMTDGFVNGPGTNASGSIFVNLLDNAGKVIASRLVNADGSYSFGSVPAGDYTILLSGVLGVEGSTMTTSTLPVNWVSTGEQKGAPGTTTGIDAATDGKLTFTVASGNISNLNFGVDQRPEADDKIKNVTGAPVIGNPVVLDIPMGGSDLEDTNDLPTGWNLKSVIITTLPTSSFVLKYNNVIINAGDTIEDYNPALLTIEPTVSTPNGTQTTSFTYATIDSAGMKDLSPATYTVNFTQPLPVDLIKFTVMATGDCNVSVNWTTATERNFSSFYVERSVDGATFGVLNKVAAKGSNSTYNYVDAHAVKGLNLYRLRLQDKDNTITYSKIQDVNTTCAGEGKISIYPNPASNALHILSGEEIMKATVIDNLGKTIFVTTKLKNNQIDISGLAPGIYHIMMETQSGNVVNHKFVKTK